MLCYDSRSHIRSHYCRLPLLLLLFRIYDYYTRITTTCVRPTAAAAHTAGAIIISVAQSAPGDIILLWLFHFIRYGLAKSVRFALLLLLVLLLSSRHYIRCPNAAAVTARTRQ